MLTAGPETRIQVKEDFRENTETLSMSSNRQRQRPRFGAFRKT